MTLKIRVTRDSVAAGDDADAPHERTFSFRDSPAPLEAVARIVAEGYLARTAGGRATWSVVSGVPLAVVSQQWHAPRLVPWQEPPWSQLAQAKGIHRLHFNYHTQTDPELLLRILKDLKLRGPEG
jgi:hypothetical protein